MITLANWPVVLIDFAIEALFQLALMVPVLGGAFMVAAVLGVDIRELVVDGLRETAGLVVTSLSTAPSALATFVAAVGLVGFGGSLIMFYVKMGTLALLVDADRHVSPTGREPMALSDLPRAWRFDLERLIRVTRHFGSRALALGALLASLYAIGAAGYLAALGLGAGLSDAVWAWIWPVLVLLSTSATFVAITVAHLFHDLLRVIVLTDDCGVLEAGRRLRHFLLADARHVLGIFAVMTAVLILAGTVGLLVAGGLTLVAWVPVVGVLAVPLQIAAWLLRGLAVQALSLTGICAYQAQYRRSPPSALTAGVTAESAASPISVETTL
jgi:hypothetical protein